MTGICADRERRWWRIAGGISLAIYLSLYPLQFLLDALRARGLLAPTVAACFALVAGGVVIWLVRRRGGLRAWLALAVAGTLYLALMTRLEVVQERFHLLEYGALALVLRRALAESFARRWRGRALAWRAGGGAILGAALVGWGDELIQALLPNRVYDLRDVGFNALAAALAIGTLAALGAPGGREGA